MGAPHLTIAVTESIIMDWRLGQLSQHKIAEKYKVSVSIVNRICKPIARDLVATVNDGIRYNQQLIEKDRITVNAIQDCVNDSLRIKRFFVGAHELIARTVINKIQNEKESASFGDLNSAASAVSKAQDGIFGKSPETTIINNNSQNVPKVSFAGLSDSELADMQRMLEKAQKAEATIIDAN